VRLAGMLIALQSAGHKGRLRRVSSPLKPKDGLNGAPGGRLMSRSERFSNTMWIFTFAPALTGLGTTEILAAAIGDKSAM
jgi:hypothetical protein